MREDYETGPTYLVSTGRIDKAWNAPHLTPGAVYYYQEPNTRMPLMSYTEISALIKQPPTGTVLIESQMMGNLTTKDYYDAGHRLIITDETAVQTDIANRRVASDAA